MYILMENTLSNIEFGVKFFNIIKFHTKSLTQSGYTVYLGADGNLVVGENKRAIHHDFYPESPLIQLTVANCPSNMDELRDLFIKSPIFAPKSDQTEDMEISRILQSSTAAYKSQKAEDATKEVQQAEQKEKKPRVSKSQKNIL